MSSPLRYSRSEPRQMRQLVPLFFIIFFDSFGYFLVIPVLLRLFIHVHHAILPESTSMAVRDLLYGVSLTLSPLAFLLAAPMLGHLSDRFGRKKILFYSLLAAVVGFLLPIIGILQRSVLLVLLGRFIAGASSSSQPIAQAAIADFSGGKKKALYFSMIACAMTLAMVLGPLVGGYLSDPTIVSWFSVLTPYWIGVILSIVNILLVWLFFYDHSQLLIKPNKASWKQRMLTLYQAISKKSIAGLLLVFLLLELAWSQYYQSIFLFLTQKFNYSPDLIGVFTGYIGLWMLLGLTVVYPVVIRYVSIERFLHVSLVVATIGILGCNYYPNATAQWVFIVPTAISVGTAYVSLIALLSNRAAADHQGLVLGIASTVLGLSWMITGFLSGLLVNWFLPLPLIVSAVAILLSLVLLPIWLRPATMKS